MKLLSSGITDGSELNQQTDPNDPDSKPSSEWFVLTGDSDENIAKTRSRTITIPKGQSRLVVVLLASDEFSEFTDPESGYNGEFNDILNWNIWGGSTVKHFVTPKKSTELPQDYVELKAVGVDVATFDKLLEWEGGEAGSTIDRRKVKRDATGMTEVKLKLKKDGAVAVTMQVWVVWATVTATPGTADFVPYPASAKAEWEIGNAATTCWRFKFKIEPAAICDFSVIEIPDLTGERINPVPGAGKPFPTDPTLIGDSADKKNGTCRGRPNGPSATRKAYPRRI